MRTHTEFIDFYKLTNAHGAPTVVKIALVCNDLATANSCPWVTSRISNRMH